MRFPDLPGYRYVELLSEDPFAWTFLASHKERERCLLRVFKSQSTSDRFLYPFFKTLSEPHCPLQGVAKVHDFLLQGPQGLTACALPFFGWKGREGEPWQVSSLQSLAEMLTREQRVQVIHELGRNLGELHEANLFHGGLRPSGIYLTGDSQGGQRVQIADFGQIFMGGLQYLEAGDFLFYAAPEQLATGDFNEGRGKQWDVYSFGVIAFQLLTGHLPRIDLLRRYHEEHPTWLGSNTAILFGESTETISYFISHLSSEAEIEWPSTSGNPDEKRLWEIIASCLSYSPEERPASMQDVSTLLKALPSSSRAETVVASSKSVPLETRQPLEKTAPIPVEREAAREEAPVTSVTKPEHSQPLAVLDEGGIFASEREAKMGRSSFFAGIKNFWEDLREIPVLRWQVTAIGSLMVSLVLIYFAFFNYWEASVAKSQVEIDLQRERESAVNKQADAYRRMQAVKMQNSKLTSEINNVENSKNELLGQAKLARQLLRETQDSGDRFFRLVLENRDTDVPEFREGRAAALIDAQRHYERLIETYGDASDFIVSTANAFFYLGQIYKEMGEFPHSLASFGEAERRYTALLEQESTSDVQYIKNIAVAKQELGELAVRSGEYSEARHFFTESSRFWTEARSREPSFASRASLHIHENSLSIVECEIAMDRLDAAIDAAMSVGVSLTEMQKSAPEDHRVIGALARSFALAGRVLESRRELDLARQSYQQASDLYAKAVELDAAVDDYLLGLGNSLARVGLLSNDTGKLEGAAEILGRVVALNPYETLYLKTLADVYGVLAVGQRDGGKMKNAIALEERAISILKPIVEKHPNVAPDVKFSFSQRLAHLAEMLGDSGKFDESRAPLKTAIGLLEDLVKDKNALSDYHRTLARTRGLAGFACIKSGKKGEAKEYLELAKVGWQSYAASNPDDDAAAQAVKWTAEQLAKLQ